MTRTMMLAAALVFASPVFAGEGVGNGTQDRAQLQVKDGTCDGTQKRLRLHAKDGVKQQLRAQAKAEGKGAGHMYRGGRK